MHSRAKGVYIPRAPDGRAARGGGGADMAMDLPYYARAGWGRPGGGGAKKSAQASGKRGVYFSEGKFILKGGLNVKIRYPFDNHLFETRPSYSAKDPIYKILDRYLPGTDLNTVSKALAKVGASFMPWDDGTPGNYSTPRHPVYV